GRVASLVRPGGNLTGLSNQLGDTASKRLELLREVAPGLRRLAILANVGNPGAVLDMREAQAAVRMLGLEAVILEIRRAEDIGPRLRRGQRPRGCPLFLCRSVCKQQPRSHLWQSCGQRNDHGRLMIL